MPSLALRVKSVWVSVCMCVSVSLISFWLAIEVWHFRGNLLNCLLPLKQLLQSSVCVCAWERVCVFVCVCDKERETCINISFSFRLKYRCEREMLLQYSPAKGSPEQLLSIRKALSLSLWVSQMFYLSLFLKNMTLPLLPLPPPFRDLKRWGNRYTGLVWA